MIGRIHGKVLKKSVTEVLVDVGGVGYEIDIPLSTYARIGNSETITLHTHLVVRDDAHLLYGFYTSFERELFRALIKVNRVGPKLALAILSGMEADALARCIRSKDEKTLSSLRGVGAKTANQIILDLKDKVPEMEGGPAAPIRTQGGNMADAESALIQLGFKPQEAALALAKVEDPNLDVETLIRQALRGLG